MKRRVLLSGVAALPLLSGCFWGRYFDLSWDEEVLLHDGRVIVVKVTHTYERLHRGFTQYGGTNLTRDTTFTFDAGGTAGVVTQFFKGFHPMFLGQHDGVWYGVLYGSYYDRSRELPGQDWGELEGPYGQWAICLIDSTWQPMSMSRLPAVFQTPNMLILKGAAIEHAKFDGKRVTLRDKQAWLDRYPLDYGDIRLTRPTSASPKRSDSVLDKTTTGEAK